MAEIYFFKEDIKFDLRKLKRHKAWLNKVAISHGYQVSELNYIFCSDKYLHKINVEYLDHDTYTDIITFDLREDPKNNFTLESDIYISVERVIENASTRRLDMIEELSRVMAHGLLHLMGKKDKTAKEKQEMRLAEDRALELF